MTWLNLRGWVGALPAASGAFTNPTTPASSSATKVALNPNFTAGPTGKCPYRQWSPPAVLEGISYYCNGYDQPWSWNPEAPSVFYDIGGAAPTTFVVADAAGGGTFSAGTVLRYKLVFGNSTTLKKTAPQTSTLSDETVTFVQYTMSGTKDAYITWTDPGGEYDKAYIYRALQDSDTFHLVATVTASTALYTDSTTDANLRGNTPIVERYRTTALDIYEGVFSHLNRLWFYKPDDSVLYYSAAARADGERVQEDVSPLNYLPVGQEDGLGGIRAGMSYYDSAFVFKRRGCYEFTGVSASTFVVRRVFSDRGACNANCVAYQEGMVFVLDDRGLYVWTPGAEPLVAGARAGMPVSPLQPIWDRMNLSVAKKFSVRLRPAQRIVEVYVALDYEPVPNKRICFDYGTNQFVSIDDMVWGTAVGVLEDSQGVQHDVHLDDLGYLWEDDYAASEGVSAGDNTGTVSANTTLTLTCGAAAFNTTTATGAPGAPVERYSSAGAVLDQNRVYAASSTVLTLYYYSSATVTDAADTVALGVIPGVFRTPKLALDTARYKSVQQVVIGHESGVSGTIKVETARNDGAFAAAAIEPSLSTAVQSLVPVRDNDCRTWSLQVSQRYANLGFSIRYVEIFTALGSEHTR